MKREDLLAPEQYNLVEEVEKFAADQSKIALIWENESGEKKNITYHRLIERVNKVGNVFLNHGLQKGDTVLVIIPRLIEAYEVYLGALKIGLTVLPSSEMLRAKDLQYRITHGDVKGIISYYPFIDQVKELKEAEPLVKFSIGQKADNWFYLDEEMELASSTLTAAETKKDDMAFLSYTSGTTGNPKGVVHTHGWAFAHLRTAAPHWLLIEEGDIVWATAGPGWQKWVWSPFLSVLGSGATGFVYNGKYDPKNIYSFFRIIR